MRGYVYWPKMDNDITDMIEKCKGKSTPPTTFKNRTTMVEDTC